MRARRDQLDGELVQAGRQGRQVRTGRQGRLPVGEHGQRGALVEPVEVARADPPADHRVEGFREKRLHRCGRFVMRIGRAKDLDGALRGAHSLSAGQLGRHVEQRPSRLLGIGARGHGKLRWVTASLPRSSAVLSAAARACSPADSRPQCSAVFCGVGMTSRRASIAARATRPAGRGTTTNRQVVQQHGLAHVRVTAQRGGGRLVNPLGVHTLTRGAGKIAEPRRPAVVAVPSCL